MLQSVSRSHRDSYDAPFNKLYRAAQVRELDRSAVVDLGITGYELMKRAGKSVFRQIQRHWPDIKCISIFCGGGNNGGDGYVVAALARQQGMSVQLFALQDPQKLKNEAAEAYAWVRELNIPIIRLDHDDKTIVQITGEIIVDALLGTGLQSVVRADYNEAIAVINKCSAPVLAVDIPSGLHSDTGMPLGNVVNAQHTLTFIGCKQGLLTGQAGNFTGQVFFDDLGVGKETFNRIKPASERVDLSIARSYMPPREPCSHKGSYGHVLIIGGDAGMGGAAIMAAEAAIRAGAGLVSCATHPDHVNAGLVRCPEVMFRGVVSRGELVPMIDRASVLVLGPGLGKSPWGQMCFASVIEAGKPMVIDADGLNLLAAQFPQDRNADWVLTPHPGEASRLLDWPVSDINKDRFATVTTLYEKFGGALLLKGAGTLIAGSLDEFDADKAGDAYISLVDQGNPGMATAGMGDVLSGIIGALLAQHLTPRNAAVLGACWHAAAADAALKRSGQFSTCATDVICGLGAAWSDLSGNYG